MTTAIPVLEGPLALYGRLLVWLGTLVDCEGALKLALKAQAAKAVIDGDTAAAHEPLLSSQDLG